LPLASPLLQTSLRDRAPDRQGKVRDIYDFGDRLLLVATDRLSAFDHVLGSGIPDKGKVLTQISAFWFDRTRAIVPNHLISIDPSTFPPSVVSIDWVRGRSMLVRRTEPLSIECVARGYLSGSGWKDYVARGEVCGIRLPAGLRESEQLPEPIFTPATKAQSGHDINISAAQAAAIVGRGVFDRVRELTLALYREGAAYAESKGIIIADTKFEFGLLPDDGTKRLDDRLILIDEAMTPDSSRFWPRDGYRPGGPQPSFDKQFVRDYLEQIKWNKQPPVPSLPDDVVTRTRDKYLEAFRRLTDRELA
jgi:phosphoribosylaminoimidazole-succinocarboxamide synthase